MAAPPSRGVAAWISCLTVDEGGRRHGIHSGYRASIFWTEDAHEGNDALLTWEGCERVEPGAAAVARLAFLRPDLVADRLNPGQRFWLREGVRVVARGVIHRD